MYQQENWSKHRWRASRVSHSFNADFVMFKLPHFHLPSGKVKAEIIIFHSTKGKRGIIHWKLLHFRLLVLWLPEFYVFTWALLHFCHLREETKSGNRWQRSVINHRRMTFTFPPPTIQNLHPTPQCSSLLPRQQNDGFVFIRSADLPPATPWHEWHLVPHLQPSWLWKDSSWPLNSQSGLAASFCPYNTHM